MKNTLNCMDTIINTVGYKLTAKLHPDQTHLFDNEPSWCRLRVGKDHLDRWVLFIHESEIAVKPEWFHEWFEGWKHV